MKRGSGASASAKAGAKPKKTKIEKDEDAVNPPVLGQEQAQHLVKIHEAWKIIRGCPIFDNVQSRKPLKITQGGNQEPFDQKGCSTVLQAPGNVEKDPTKAQLTYACGGNLAWIDSTWLVNHRVPFNQAQLSALRRDYFPANDPPSYCPFTFTIAIESYDFQVEQHMGSLQRISPEEVEHSIILSTAEAIATNQDEVIINRWLRLFLTVPFVFEVWPPGNSRFWRGHNLREMMVDKGEKVKRTISQRVWDIAGFKMDTEKTSGALSSAKVSELYKKNVKLASSSEPISSTFVDSALTVYSRILTVPENVALLTYCDERWFVKGHPFSSIYSLQAICDRCSTQVRINNALVGLVDHYRMGFINIGEFVQSKIKDRKTSYCNVLNKKMEARVHLLGQWLDALNISASAKNKIREVNGSFEAVRKNLTAYPDEPPCDLSFQCHWKPSECLVCAFIEDVCYTTVFDGRYKDICKISGEIADFLEYQSVAERINEIKDAINKERPSKQ